MTALDWRDIRGWLTEREGLTLRELARGLDVLELGAYCGRSTVCMADVATLVVTIDSFREGTRDEFTANIEAAGVGSRVVLCATDITSPMFLKWHGQFDLVYVDSYHDLISVRRDTEIALACVRPGGTIAWHDYGDPMWPDVAGTLDRMGLVPDRVVDRLAWRVMP